MKRALYPRPHARHEPQKPREISGLTLWKLALKGICSGTGTRHCVGVLRNDNSVYFAKTYKICDDLAEYSISAKEEKELLGKVAVFEAETRTKKAVHLTMVTTYGIAKNIHSGIVQSEITMDGLFL